jgi:hypothetical protein
MFTRLKKWYWVAVMYDDNGKQTGVNGPGKRGLDHD